MEVIACDFGVVNVFPAVIEMIASDLGLFGSFPWVMAFRALLTTSQSRFQP